MNFGKVPDPDLVDFTLPADQLANKQLLHQPTELSDVRVGFPKWNKKDLPGLYPKGVKDELKYYSTQFNAIELNATFYNSFSNEQIVKWKDRSSENFKFFPKVHQYISHVKRLNDTRTAVDRFCESVWHFGDKLGMVFLQLHDNFSPSSIDRLTLFIEEWPHDLPLAVELRHTDWFNDPNVSEIIFALFEKHNITTILTDTAGRRDLLHMRLTSNKTFVRFVGANHPSDYKRLDDWAGRLKLWSSYGLQTCNFFIHQNLDVESPLLSQYFIKKLNKELACNHHTPNLIGSQQTSLF